MSTKAELVTEIYLLLATIHLHGFDMSLEMAQQIFDRWPMIISERPKSPKAVLESYNAILQQRPARIITQAAAETSAKIETPQPAQTQRIIKSESKSENTPQLAQKHKAVRDENTPKSQNKKTISNKNTSSPFSLTSHSRQHNPTPNAQTNTIPKPTVKPTPKPIPIPKLESKTTPAPRVPKLEFPATAYKKEPTGNHLPSLSIASSFSAKRAFVDLSNDTSSDDNDDDDETPSKAPRMG
ncbi:hypothetical protein M436DRAFT_62225 [Aureobasidium namibiae CBS 147.97]|uniref:Uncharacterized protein n=1 Tax=Aureobasidium namibiae CBS 147.97 TaxID=1043004 RepID=A0A074XJQ7_9PEZI